MKQSGLGIIVALGLTLPALADPPQLIGEYVWTYNDTCIISSGGFSAPPGLAPGGASAIGQTYATSGADTGGSADITRAQMGPTGTQRGPALLQKAGCRIRLRRQS
jgi:hypothetical protein